MKQLQRFAAGLTLAAFALLGSGCTTTVVLMHLHDQWTEGDPTPCRKLNSVERALQPRCGPYVAGSLQTQDVVASGLPRCPLTLAARDPQHWPMLPELISRGAMPELCEESPLVALAQEHPCPDFALASPQALQALRWLAKADARAVHHDVVRAFSCPAARARGLDRELDSWLAQGQLERGRLGFGPLGALHPSHLDSPLARALESAGHRAIESLGGYDGQLTPGFEEALRTGDWAALDWWLTRMPQLANRVPPSRSGQLAWMPLARVLTPPFMTDPDLQRRTVEFLLARGADPYRALPHEPGLNVVELARRQRNPLLATLEAPAGIRTAAPAETMRTALPAAATAAAGAAGPAPARR
jgi:hypothetical protein